MFISTTVRKNREGFRFKYLQPVHKCTKAGSLVKRIYKAFGLKLHGELKLFPVEEGEFGVL